MHTIRLQTVKKCKQNIVQQYKHQFFLLAVSGLLCLLLFSNMRVTFLKKKNPYEESCCFITKMRISQMHRSYYFSFILNVQMMSLTKLVN